MKSYLVLAMFALVSSGVLYGYGPQHSRTRLVMSHSNDGGWLGVSVQDVTKRFAESKHLKANEGAYVVDVVDDSPADRTGIREGDIIVGLDGKKIADSEDLIRAVRKTPPRSEVKIDIVRGEEQKTLTAKLERAPRTGVYSFGFGDGGFFPRPLPRPPRVRLPGFGFRYSWGYGLVLEDLTRQLAEYFEVPEGKGVLVAEVKKESEAQKSGVKAGDVITKIDSEEISHADELIDAFNDVEKGTDVRLSIIRKGTPMTITLKVEAEDDDDDVSDDFTAPRGYFPDYSPRAFPFRQFNWEGMERLQEQLQSLQNSLRGRMLDLRSRLGKELEEL
jgi:serine protease Do